MISLVDVSFRYSEGDFRLGVPRLEIESGEAVAVIGPSGSGKTTLLNLVAGIVAPQRGQVVTAGAAMSELDDAARRSFRIRNLGLVFQEFELLDYLNVRDNILLPYRIHHRLRLSPAVRRRAEELAAEVGITEHLDRHVHHLSQGERQRVAVCRALLTGPSVLLADEPTGNLDPRNKDRVLDILFDFARTEGATLLTVTHDHELLARFDRVVDFKQFLSEDERSEQA